MTDQNQNKPALDMAARIIRLRKLAIRAGERLYDEEVGLCHGERVGLKYDCTDVFRPSIDYVRGLFEDGTQLDRANRILSRIIDNQETDSSTSAYGNFGSTEHKPMVRDTNAVSFIVYSIGDLLLEMPERVTPANAVRLKEAMSLASIGLLRHGIVWFYTNIRLFNIADAFVLARLLGRKDLEDCAVAEWRRWMERTREENICEFNSAAYLPVQFGALLAIQKYAADPVIAAEARAAADFLVLTFSANFHPPTGLLTGTQSRAYRGFLAEHQTGDRPFLYYLFGAPELPEMSGSEDGIEAYLGSVFFTRYSSYTPPQQALDMQNNRQYPFEIVERNASFFGKDNAPGIILRKNYQTPKFTFATQDGVYAHYRQDVPILISIPQAPKRKFIFCENEPPYALIDTYLQQRESWAIGGLYHHVGDWNTLRSWWFDGPPFRCERRLNLGPIDDIELLVEGHKWDGSELALNMPFDITAVRSGVGVGLRAFLPPADSRTHPVSVRMIVADGDALVAFSFLNERDPEIAAQLPPAVVGLFINVWDEAAGCSNAYAAASVTQNVADGLWRLSCGLNNQKAVAEVPLTPDSRERLRLRNLPPIAESHFECPGISIKFGA